MLLTILFNNGLNRFIDPSSSEDRTIYYTGESVLANAFHSWASKESLKNAQYDPKKLAISSRGFPAV
jgi:hypothetical protein